VERSDVECGRYRQQEKNERERAAFREPECEPDEESFQASRPVGLLILVLPPHYGMF